MPGSRHDELLDLRSFEQLHGSIEPGKTEWVLTTHDHERRPMKLAELAGEASQLREASGCL
jgi:hypothetical protein